MENKIYYKWFEFDEDILKLIDQINESGFKPDYILGIARGGVTLATKLSYCLDIPVKYFKTNSDLFITNVFHSGVKLLVVDDINDTGETIKSARKNIYKLIQANNRNDGKNYSSKEYIKFLTLYNNLGSSTTVDFSVIEIDKRVDNSWISFPWENENS